MKTVLALLITASIAALPLAAHHSMRAEYDDSKIVIMSVVVKEVDWVNPHAKILVNVTDPAGRAAEWTIELPSPNVLGREGLKRNDLKPGDLVTMGVWLAKEGEGLAALRMVTLPGNRTVSIVDGWDFVLNKQR